jgi:hypothetical protein
MAMKRMKAWQDLVALNVATNERFENRRAFRAGELALNAIMSISQPQRCAAALHLCIADFSLRPWFYSKITHEMALYLW